MDKGRPAAVYIILLAIGIIAGGAGVYFFARQAPPAPMAPTAKDGAAGDGAPKEKKIIYWRAPMNPNYISDKPGKSPMGMDLVPVYEGEEGAEPGTVKIDPVTVQNIGVRTGRVKRMALARDIRTVGRVDYDEKRVTHVNTKIEGWVEKLYIDFTGQKVKKNDILLEIYSPKLVSTQEEYLLAKGFSAGDMDDVKERTVPGAGSVLETARRRLELLDVPAHQIRELNETGRIMKTLHIHSPVAGVVVNKNVFEGMFVKPGISLYTIADISKVWVYADVYEYEMPWIKAGQEAEITFAAYPGKVFRGKVSFVYPFMEPKTRTVKVRLEVDNTSRMLKPDMYADVTLRSSVGRSALAVPTEAVILSGERSLVILARGNGKFTPREVTLGVEADGHYEVVKGLSDGDEVVTSAHFLIDSESRLREAVTKMLDVKKVPGAEDPAKKGQPGHDMGGMNGHAMEGIDHQGMEGMDHSAMEGMDHSGHDMGKMDGHAM
ncbi:MAG: efflux RND transporter periplasmic adaptor subunit, partial [Thermodesulfobacteriota bacterium]